MRVDSHQHFWIFDPEEYPWISHSGNFEDSNEPGDDTLHERIGLDRDFLPNDLRPLLKSAGIDGCIAVQARQNLQENDFLLGLAAQHSFIKGVVGWVDLRSNSVQQQIEQFAENRKAVGIRHVVQDEPHPQFMAGAAFRHGIACMNDTGLVYDILIFEHQLSDAISLVESFPNQQFVIDHIAKPRIKDGLFEPWRTLISKLAKMENTVVKVSGMVTEADHLNWNAEQLSIYWETVLEQFSPGRIMFGSDWPVMRLASSYDRWISVVSEWLAPLSSAERSAIWRENAERIYLRNGVDTE